MQSRLVAAVFATAMLAVAIPAHSQNIDREAELIGMHQLCDHGDRQACVRFGFMLGQNQERHAEWRKSHPDWWLWEHH
jgi:hypothetical protein